MFGVPDIEVDVLGVEICLRRNRLIGEPLLDEPELDELELNEFISYLFVRFIFRVLRRLPPCVEYPLSAPRFSAFLRRAARRVASNAA